MNKNVLLISAIIMCMACPAFADTFPADGYMLENKTYTSAATYENLGAYEGPLAATAEYDNTLYNIPAGQYLAADTTTGTQCTAGNFCTGLTNVTYDENNDQGLTACSTLDNGAYPNSEAGATANTDCYHACTTSDSNIAHAASYTGNAYYGGTNTCELASCESGYHIKPAIFTPDSSVQTAIGNTNAYQYGYIDNSGTYTNRYNSGDQSFFEIAGSNAFALEYRNIGILRGRGRCSTMIGHRNSAANSDSSWSNPTSFDILTDETGQNNAYNCYCHVESYTPSGSATQSLSSPWVFVQRVNSVSDCGSGCASLCAALLYNNTIGSYVFRSSFLSTVGSYSDPSCVSDTITITWSDASQADIEANNAGTATWGGDIRTPRAATSKKGKTFKGWKFTPAN